MAVSAPSWRARIVIAGVAFVAVLVTAWVYIPDTHDAVRVLWGDAKAQARDRL